MNPQSLADLLPCPFCGGEARLQKMILQDRWLASCTNVECPVDLIVIEPERAEAITAWNTRQAAAEVRGGGWLPIESVPVGSRKVVVLISNAGPNGYVTDPWTGWKNGDGTFSRWPHDFPPTHFQPLDPLPSPPGAVGEGGDDGSR